MGMSLSLSGTPGGIIDTVQDADEMVGAIADNTVEAVAEFGSLNFLRVPAADGGQVVGIDDPALEKIHVAVEFEARHG